MPHCVSCLCHHVGGADLFEAELRVRVDVAPDGGNPGGLGDDGESMIFMPTV
jgi:hypothetical protein